jgi:hypothetical protein
MSTGWIGFALQRNRTSSCYNDGVNPAPELLQEASFSQLFFRDRAVVARPLRLTLRPKTCFTVMSGRTPAHGSGGGTVKVSEGRSF